MAEKSRMPALKALVDAFKTSEERNDSWVSGKIGPDRGLLWSWWNRGLEHMPSPAQLYALSVAIQTPYGDVLDAALHDFGYRPESNARNVTLLEDAGEDVLLPSIESQPS